VDTEAGIEHFGRGVLEGVDAVLLVVDPSREAVLLAEKAARLCREAEKPFLVVINKADRESEDVLRDMLAAADLRPSAALAFSPDIFRVCLEGSRLAGARHDGSLGELVAELEEIVMK
jgi:CO dehydrogenase maturation factor